MEDPELSIMSLSSLSLVEEEMTVGALSSMILLEGVVSIRRTEGEIVFIGFTVFAVFITLVKGIPFGGVGK